MKFRVKDPKCILGEFSKFCMNYEFSGEISNEISNFQMKFQMHFRSRKFAPLRGAKFKNFTWLCQTFQGTTFPRIRFYTVMGKARPWARLGPVRPRLRFKELGLGLGLCQVKGYTIGNKGYVRPRPMVRPDVGLGLARLG